MDFLSSSVIGRTKSVSKNVAAFLTDIVTADIQLPHRFVCLRVQTITASIQYCLKPLASRFKQVNSEILRERRNLGNCRMNGRSKEAERESNGYRQG